MKDLWRKYAARFDALAQRERVMVFIAAIAATLFVIDALFIGPPAARSKALLAQVAQQELALATLQPQIQALEKRLVDPDAANAARRDGIKRQIADIDQTLKGMQQSLVGAQRMKALVQEMLARNPRLQLVSLRTLPVAPLVDRSARRETSAAASSEPPAPADAAVFKHGVQITLQGSYADLYDYLGHLEKLSWRMFWSHATLSAEGAPRLTLTVTLYTLSLDKAWLVV